MHSFGNKTRFTTMLLCICTFTATSLLAQTKQTASNTTYSGTVTELSFKNVHQPTAQTTRPEDVVWKRDVYRILDLNNIQNAPLYYPVEASADKRNLFSTIFDAVSKNNLKAYTFMDDREVFTEEFAVKFKDVLKRFDIPYVEKSDPKQANSTIFEVNPVDIPSREVTLFYLKEITYLDQRTSSIKTKAVAICPVRVSTDDYEGIRRTPFFWIPIESLKPLLSAQGLAADSLNSAERITMYDYFNQRRYKGDIYKVSNLKNQNIYDYCKTPEAIKAEQERLEKELSMRSKAIWETYETAPAKK
jgi:gliding motility associated protien GldN